MDYQPGGYRLLRRPAPPAGALRLDAAQQAVVSHPGGPLLVLAGPGTGKTTAIVEAVVERITQRQIDPERVLVLTFSRKAAQELRERITTRLRRTTRQPLALTFHSYAYALVRREFVLAGDLPPTLLSGPEQLLEVRRMLRAEAGADPGDAALAIRPAGAGRGRSGPRWPPAASPPSCVTSCSARPSVGWTAGAWPGWAARRAATTGSRRAASWTGTSPGSTWRQCPLTTTPRSSGWPRRCSAGPVPGTASAKRTTSCWWTSTRTPTRPRKRCCTRWPGTAGS